MLNNIIKMTIGTIGCLGEIAVELFSHTDENNDNNKYDEMKQNTYDYFMRLSYGEIEEYFENNTELRKYKNTHLYNDRHQTAKHVADLAYKLGREFTNKYDRY